MLLLTLGSVGGFALGWFARGYVVRSMWKASLRFRRAAMGFSRQKGGDDVN
jgi:hypothetical protein